MNAEKTQKFWEKRTSQPITPEKAREIIENTAGFFKVLADWDQRSEIRMLTVSARITEDKM